MFDFIAEIDTPDVDLIRLLAPLARNDNTIETLRKACASRSINLDAMLPPTKSTAPVVQTRPPAESGRVQELESQVSLLKLQLQRMENTLRSLEIRMNQAPPVVVETSVQSAPPAIVAPGPALNEAEPSEDKSNTFFSPKKPKRTLSEKRKREGGSGDSQPPAKKKGSLFHFMSTQSNSNNNNSQ